MVELVDDRLFRGDERHDFQPGDAPDVVDGQDVERVGHGEEQLVFEAGDGDDLVIVGDLARAAVRRSRRECVMRAQVDGRRVEDAAHGDGHVLLADVGLFEDELEEAGAVLLLLLEQFVHLLERQQAVLDQGVGDAFSK